MKRVNKKTSEHSVSAILRGNEGTSLVLVSIIAIIIITSVVILRMTVGALWASADKQLNQDQAYEMATSMGETVDTLVLARQIKLDGYSSYPYTIADQTVDELPNATVTVQVRSNPIDAKTFDVVTEAHVAGAVYIYTATYTGAGTSYTRLQ